MEQVRMASAPAAPSGSATGAAKTTGKGAASEDASQSGMPTGFAALLAAVDGGDGVETTLDMLVEGGEDAPPFAAMPLTEQPEGLPLPVNPDAMTGTATNALELDTLGEVPDPSVLAWMALAQSSAAAGDVGRVSLQAQATLMADGRALAESLVGQTARLDGAQEAARLQGAEWGDDVRSTLGGALRRAMPMGAAGPLAGASGMPGSVGMLAGGAAQGAPAGGIGQAGLGGVLQAAGHAPQGQATASAQTAVAAMVDGAASASGGSAEAAPRASMADVAALAGASVAPISTVQPQPPSQWGGAVHMVEGAGSASGQAEIGEGGTVQAAEAAFGAAEDALEEARAELAEKLAERVSFWVHQRAQHAAMTVERDGAAVQIRVSLTGDQAHIAFRSDHDQARQALDAGIQELRDMLRGQGLELAGMSVSAGGQDGRSGQGGAEGNGRDPAQGRAGWQQGRVQVEAAPDAALGLRSGTVYAERSVDIFV